MLQSHLAVGQSQGPQIVAAFEQQVESEVDKRIGLALGKGCLERREIRRAVFVEGANLAIDDRIRQLAGGSRNGRIFVGPIKALTGLQGRLAVKHAYLEPVTIKLDLVDPTFR